MQANEFEDIYSEYFSVVYRYIYVLSQNPTIAEDVTQETFFKAMKNINQFKGDCKLSVWLCQIAKNTYYTLYNKEKKISAQNKTEILDFSLNLERDFIQKESIKIIHHHLHHLNEPYKEVFTLRVFAELSFLEIGNLFGRKDGWARLVFYRAKKQLQEECK